VPMALSLCSAQDEEEDEEQQSLVVVGGGAAGVYASIRAKSLAPQLNVVIIEKGRFLSKVQLYFAFTQLCRLPLP
jgi:NADH dehydrogenase FAD-containing subunit